MFVGLAVVAFGYAHTEDRVACIFLKVLSLSLSQMKKWSGGGGGNQMECRVYTIFKKLYINKRKKHIMWTILG